MLSTVLVCAAVRVVSVDLRNQEDAAGVRLREHGTGPTRTRLIMHDPFNFHSSFSQFCQSIRLSLSLSLSVCQIKLLHFDQSTARSVLRTIGVFPNQTVDSLKTDVDFLVRLRPASADKHGRLASGTSMSSNSLSASLTT